MWTVHRSVCHSLSAATQFVVSASDKWCYGRLRCVLSFCVYACVVHTGRSMGKTCDAHGSAKARIDDRGMEELKTAKKSARFRSVAQLVKAWASIFMAKSVNKNITRNHNPNGLCLSALEDNIYCNTLKICSFYDLISTDISWYCFPSMPSVCLCIDRNRL